MVMGGSCACGEQSVTYRLVATLCCALDMEVTLCVIKNCRDFSKILTRWVWRGASESELLTNMGDSTIGSPWTKGLRETLLQGRKYRLRVEACSHIRALFSTLMEESVLGWDVWGVPGGMERVFVGWRGHWGWKMGGVFFSGDPPSLCLFPLRSLGFRWPCHTFLPWLHFSPCGSPEFSIKLFSLVMEFNFQRVKIYSSCMAL